ncbi:MAG: AsmA family protein [Flavobacteriales bacterium]|nr:AsmA family protein [Flavobacteriales bacterium]MCB9192619.1 AsmA family protein [Flavobacteriales bacterium]
MKKLLIVLGVIVLLLVAAIIIVPLVVMEPITKAVKEEANKNLNATVDFKDVDVSLIWSFPDIYVGVNELSVTGKGEFEGRTLLYLKTLALDVNLLSAFTGSPVINQITFAEGLANVIVLEDGAANYDIVPESEETAEEAPAPEEGTSALVIKLKEFKISNLEVMYSDKQGGMTFSTTDLDLTLSGDFEADRTTFKTNIAMVKTKLAMGGVSYLNGVEMELDAGVDADLASKSFTLKDNEFRINGLHLSWNGNISMPNDEDINLDLIYAASKTEFKEILSLVPAIYAKDFADVQASGSLELSGIVKGTYNEKNIPGFTTNLKVADAQFKYPDLPKSVDNIAIDLNVTNPGEDVDFTVIDLKQFKFQLAENPFDVRALIKTPVSDPNIDASFKGKINLTSLADAIPMEEGDKLSGTIIADAEMKGKQSDLDKGRYDKFNASGEFILTDIEYSTEAVSVPVQVKYAQFKFAPRFLELASFDAQAGKSDFKMKGKITNYLGYVLSDGVLEGNFSFNSTLIEGNELAGMSTSEGQAPAETEGTSQGGETSEEPFVIPKNLDIALSTDVKKIVYDNMNLLNAKGQVVIRNGKADLKGLSFNTLGGSVAMNGYYDSSNEKKPKLNYDLDVQNIVVKDAYKTFGTVQKLAPIAEKTEGKASVKFNVLGSMKSGTEVDYNSLNGGGRLTSQSLKITGTEALDKVAQVVKINAFKNPEVKDVNLSFKFMDGRVHVSPFDVKIGPVSANIFGSHGFDETMDYVMATEVPTGALGSQANAVINGLVSQANSLGAKFTAGDKIKVDILIKGTFANPKITPSFGGSSGGGSTTENLKAAAEAELKKQQEELERKAKEEADRLKREAEERARQEAERLKREAEERAKKEAGNVLNGLFGKPKK